MWYVAVSLSKYPSQIKAIEAKYGGLLVLIKLGVRVNLHPHPAAGPFLGKLLETLRRLALGGVRRHDMAELDDDGGRRGGGEVGGLLCQGSRRKRQEASGGQHQGSETK